MMEKGSQVIGVKTQIFLGTYPFFFSFGLEEFKFILVKSNDQLSYERFTLKWTSTHPLFVSAFPFSLPSRLSV